MSLDLVIPVLEAKDLFEKLEAGHRVSWCEENTRHFICQKRGEEYVTVCASSERQAELDWKRAHEKGHYYDAQNRRVTIPGAR